MIEAHPWAALAVAPVGGECLARSGRSVVAAGYRTAEWDVVTAPDSGDMQQWVWGSIFRIRCVSEPG